MTPIEQWNADRRHAWDMYVAAFASCDYVYTTEAIVENADKMLAQRDLRFPKPEEV